MDLERLTPHQFIRFRDFIYQTCGIRIDEKKILLLSNRIRRRVKSINCDNFEAYYRFLTSSEGATELGSFLDAVTTNETFFFRTEKHFDWLQRDLVPELVTQHRAGRRPASLRIWSAACANGAEPYSIAISLAEQMHQLREWSIQILATDISEEALQWARRGRYKARSMEFVTERRKRRFFQHDAEDDMWQVRPEVSKLVDFHSHNLLDPALEDAMDCIFIRNVLIYFDHASKQIAINNLVRALAVGGYLVVGPSEGIYDMLRPLTKISPLLYQKVDSSKNGADATTRGQQP